MCYDEMLKCLSKNRLLNERPSTNEFSNSFDIVVSTDFMDELKLA